MLDMMLKQWAVPGWMYPPPAFPPYTLGSFYLIPAPRLDCLLRAAAAQPLVSVEDVFVTGLLRIHCRIPLVNVPKRYK